MGFLAHWGNRVIMKGFLFKFKFIGIAFFIVVSSAFFFISWSTALATNITYTFDDFNLGDLSGQHDWFTATGYSNSGELTNYAAYAGDKGIDFNTLDRNELLLSTTTEIFLNFKVYHQNNDSNFSFAFKNSTTTIQSWRTEYIDGHLILHSGSNNVNIYSSADYPTGSWLTHSVSVNCETQTYSYEVNGVSLVTASSTIRACSDNMIYKIQTGSANNTGDYIYFDNLSIYENVTVGASNLEWFYPRDGYVDVNNNDWSDWGLYYDMDPADIGAWNVLAVYYTGSDNNSFNDWDEVSPTTDLTYWTIDRSHDLPDGISYAQGVLFKIATSTDCLVINDPDCDWTQIAATDIITFTASSTGYDIFDGPWALTGFYPATTSSSSEADAGLLGQVWYNIQNIFPISIAKQVWQAFYAAQQGTYKATNTTFLAADLVDDKYKAALGSAVIFSPTLVPTFFGSIWTDYIYKFFKYLIYLAAFFSTIWILWPKNKPE